LNAALKKVVRIRINGKVQGVAFRYYTKIKADKLDLKGTVQNVEDGSVLVYAYGSDIQVKELCAWCKAGGPPSAIVKKVIVDELNSIPSKQYSEFSIIR
jgi:acylphosphatase